MFEAEAVMICVVTGIVLVGLVVLLVEAVRAVCESGGGNA